MVDVGCLEGASYITGLDCIVFWLYRSLHKKYN
jgi:hypothetical protein